MYKHFNEILISILLVLLLFPYYLLYVIYGNYHLLKEDRTNMYNELRQYREITVLKDEKANSIDEFFESIGSPLKGYGDYFVRLENEHLVDSYFVTCIILADTGGGKKLSTNNNWGNVGNNDRGDRVSFPSAESGIEAIYDTVNNKYHKDKTMVGEFSVGGRNALGLGKAPIYASSPYNWNKNVVSCLGNFVYNANEKYNVKNINYIITNV